MKKVALIKNKKIKSFQKKINIEEYNKIKNEGIVLKTANKNIQIEINNDIFEKDYKNPEISLYNKNEILTVACVTFPENADEAFIDYKIIEKYPTPWRRYGRIQNPVRGKIYEFESSENTGKACKFRVTYFKDNAIRYTDATLSDVRYDFFQDPPEIVVLNNESVTINVFNIERFAASGYIKIFKKENEENIVCIVSDAIKGKVFTFEDTEARNLNAYEYFAEVYDNLGNVYQTDTVKIDLRNILNRRRLKISSDEKGQYINVSNEERIEITIYDIEKENTSISVYNLEPNNVINANPNTDCICEIDKEKLYFKIDSKYKNYLIQIEGFQEEKCISYTSDIQTNQEIYKINNVRIETNKKFQNIIKWNYEGNIDSFIVTAKDFKKNRILEKLSHRKLNGNYIYCIDSSFASERLNTEYIINGIDEFGKIIAKSRIVKNG